MEAVIAAAITGAFSVLGIVISNIKSNKKIGDQIEHQLDTAQAVTDCKIEELTREVMHGMMREIMISVWILLR